MNSEYIVIPGTQTKVYVDSIVVLFRLPGTKWIIHCGTYEYNGRRRKGWYFASIPSGTTMPVFKEDLVAMRVIDEERPHPPCPPHPPGPVPPAPLPVIFTPADKLMVDRSMITVDSLEDRDELSSDKLQDGKICRVNDAEGQVEYYEWSSESSAWVLATLGYRYMTREEIEAGLDRTVVDVAFSNEDGALVVTKYTDEDLNIPLTGIAHDPSFDAETVTLRIPIFGQPDLTVAIPEGWKMTGCRYEEDYPRPDGTHGPSLVFTISNGAETEELVVNAEPITNIYQGGDTSSVKVHIDSDNNNILADVKISSVENNSIQIDNEGLLVDISGKVDKNQIEENYVLVADGLGGFTFVDPGVTIATEGVLEDLSDTALPVASIIADAITAAVAASEQAIEQEIARINARLDAVEEDIDELKQNLIGPGLEDEVVVSTASGVTRSGYDIGGDTLSPEDTRSLATENSVKDAISWKAV